MGKKKGKKKDKKVSGQEKTLAKQNKKDAKRRKKEEESVDEILADLMAKQVKVSEVKYVDDVEVPSPRVNACFVAHPTKNNLILYGGEFYNGRNCTTFGDFFLFNIQKQTWRQVHFPSGPKPRNSMAYATTEKAGGQLWVFGGEFTAPDDSFRNYRDLWCLNLSDMSWRKIETKGGPTTRVGHQMVASKTHLFVFGGFLDNGKSLKYYNDLYAFDIENGKWKKIKVPSAITGVNWPTARSAFPFFVNKNQTGAYVFGGFCSDDDKGADEGGKKGGKKDKKKDKKAGKKDKKAAKDKDSATGSGGAYDDEDDDYLGNALDDMWYLDFDSLEWSLVKQQTKGDADIKPVSRSKPAMGMFSVKNRAIMFGGVTDDPKLINRSLNGGGGEGAREKKKGKKGGKKKGKKSSEVALPASLHFNDTYIFHLDKRVWEGPLDMSGTAGDGQSKKKKKKKKKKDEESDDEYPYENNNTNDGTAAADDNDSDSDDGSDGEGGAQGKNRSGAASASICERRSAMMAVKNNTCFLWGGSLEVNEKELTFNDMFSLDCKKATGSLAGRAGVAWETIHSMPIEQAELVWADDKEGDDDDDDDDDDEKEEEEEDEEEEEEEDEDEGKEQDREEAVDLSQYASVPMGEESMNDFFNRTKHHWNALAQEQMTADGSGDADNGDGAADDEKKEKEAKKKAKLLRKMAFDLARQQYQASME